MNSSPDPARLPDADAREQAACEFEKNLVVTAGAGTGKTSLIVERVLHAVLAKRIPLTRLAVITFTEKAAAELRERIEDALEGAIVLAAPGAGTADSPAGGASAEAERAVRRLDAGARSDSAARARAALEELEVASIGTIHSFAAELLRRHPREAGVDVGFEVDADELAFAELFDELWGQLLETTLGEPTPRAKLDDSDDSDDSEAAPPTQSDWAELLEVLSLEEIETIARRACGYSIPSAVLGSESDGHQRRFLRAHADVLRAKLAAIRDELAGAPEILTSFQSVLDALEAALEEASRQGEPPNLDALAGLPKGPGPGKKSGVADAKAMRGALLSIRAQAEALESSEIGLAGRLGRVLLGLAEEFRLQYRRRGQVSFDSSLRLARDLLFADRDVREEEGKRFSQVLIDEFQDTDALQYDIAFALTSPVGGEPKDGPVPGKLFIVGDGKQSIYRFRGADTAAYGMAVERVKRTGEELTLRANFRSRPELVEPLNRLFASTFDPERSAGRDPRFDELVAQRDPSHRCGVEIWSVGDDGVNAGERRSAEARAIAAWVDDAVRARAELRYRDVAVLLRALTDVDTYLRELRRRGVPYIVEGGRKFFERYEVELLLAVLRATLNPADPVALVACLRSPLGAVPDPELQRWAEERAEREEAELWHLEATPSPEQFPALARALALLRGFVGRHRDAGLDRLALAALDELPLRLCVAASYEGAQRVANLEKAVRHIAELAREGRWRDEEILDRIETVDAVERAEADSPLADDSVDAVRVLSIHKSKGLEWPVVIVPDLARANRVAGATHGAALTSLHTGDADSPTIEALALRAGSVRTPAWIHRQEQERPEEEAEARRLLYVATTRARELLLLVVGGASKRSGESSWIKALAAWRYDPAQGFGQIDGERSSLDAGVEHVRVAAMRDDAAPAIDDDALGPLVEAAQRFVASTDDSCDSQWLPLRAPSRQDEPPTSPGEAGRSENRPQDSHRARDVARAVGSAIHLLLEAWGWSDPSWLLENAERATLVACADLPTVESARVLADVRAVLQHAEASGELARLTELEALGREVPLLARIDGQLWDGAVDLVTGSIERPEIVDYKTDANADAGELESRHHAQLDVYARGVGRALGIDGATARILALPPAAKPSRLG